MQRQPAAVQRTLARNDSRSTITRISLPAATSPALSDTDRVKTRRRPSMRSRVASAHTVPPTPTGTRWSNCRRLATEVQLPGSCAVDGHAAGLLAEGEQPRGGEDGNRSRAECLGRVGLGHLQLDAGRQTGLRSHAGTIRDTLQGEPSTVALVTVTMETRRGGAVIEPAVAERVLSEALRHGGDFAEVFAEDRVDVVVVAGRRSGRGAVVRAGAGCRHPGGVRRDHRVRPHRRPERGGVAAGGRGGLGRGQAGRRLGHHGVGGATPREVRRRTGRKRTPPQRAGRVIEGGHPRAPAPGGRGGPIGR